MKNLIFDLDGTLGDSLPLCIAAFKEAVEPFTNVELTETEIYKHFGISEDGIIKELLPNNQEEGLKSFISSYTRLLDENPDPFPGVKQLLQALSNNGIFLTMVTGKGRETANITLQKYGIDHYFQDLYVGSPIGEVKDHCINELINKHQLNRSETVYIGDALSDVYASRNCDIGIIGAGWASTTDVPALAETAPDHLFTSFTDFSTFLHQRLNLSL